MPLRELALPASRRLPPDSVEVVNRFYDFPFAAWARAQDRVLAPGERNGHPCDDAIDRLRDGSIAALTLPTPAEGPPLEEDREVAALAAASAARLLDRKSTIHA